MSQHVVLLTIAFVPCHQLSIFFVLEQTLQTWYYRKILHNLRWYFRHLGRCPLESTKIIISPDLIT
jgi:hypothetical protein